MKTEKARFKTSDSGAEVSAIFFVPRDASALFVFGHGAGAGMEHPFMDHLARILADRKIATLRYNFPYMEKNAKRPDPPAIAERTVLAAVAFGGERFPDLPLYAGGKSFGGRMTSQAMANTAASNVRGLIFLGFPLHPAGKPGTSRADHLNGLSLPMLFLQGTRDALAKLELLEPVCDALPLATLRKFDGADHSFKSGKKDLIPDLGTEIAEWTRKH